MQMCRYRPAPPLDRYIECFWWSHRDGPQDHSEHMLPSGGAQLLFALHEMPILYRPSGAEQLDRLVGEHRARPAIELLRRGAETAGWHGRRVLPPRRRRVDARRLDGGACGSSRGARCDLGLAGRGSAAPTDGSCRSRGDVSDSRAELERPDSPAPSSSPGHRAGARPASCRCDTGARGRRTAGFGLQPETFHLFVSLCGGYQPEALLPYTTLQLHGAEHGCGEPTRSRRHRCGCRLFRSGPLDPGVPGVRGHRADRVSTRRCRSAAASSRSVGARSGAKVKNLQDIRRRRIQNCARFVCKRRMP